MMNLQFQKVYEVSLHFTTLKTVQLLMSGDTVLRIKKQTLHSQTSTAYLGTKRNKTCYLHYIEPNGNMTVCFMCIYRRCQFSSWFLV